MASKKNTTAIKKAGSKILATNADSQPLEAILGRQLSSIREGNQLFTPWITKAVSALETKENKAAVENLAHFIGTQSSIIDDIAHTLKLSLDDKGNELFAALAKKSPSKAIGKNKETADVKWILGIQTLLRFQLANYQLLLVLANKESRVTDLIKGCVADFEKALDEMNDLLAANVSGKSVESKEKEEMEPKANSQEVAAVYDSINLTGKTTPE